jgi:signal transduction histidine kinase
VALLAVSVLGFGLVADHALVGQGALARERASAAAAEATRTVTVSVQAALRAIEEEVLGGRAAVRVTAFRLAVPPEPSAAGPPGAAYGRRSRSELSRLLGSTGTTPNGLPEAVVARIALGDAGLIATGPEGGPNVAERLLRGELRVRPEDLPLLARALGVGADARVKTLAQALRSAPSAALLPEAPSFRRVMHEGRAGAGDDGERVEAWCLREGIRVGYEVMLRDLLRRAGLADRARPPRAAQRGDRRVPVPDVEGLELALSDEGPGDERVRALRLALWAAVGTSIAGLLAVRRALGREARATAREKAFLASVTHELRTPLASVRLLAETLADGRGHPREYGALIAQESERLEALVEGVLSAARVDEAPRFARVEPGELVRSTVALLAPRAERRAVTLQCLASELPAATWDGEAVRRALVNLVDNAIRHGREGGHVDVRAAADRSSVSLSVRDDGPGISRQDRTSVFGRFVRGRGETGGAGLGLYLVEQVARAHGGRVELETEEGRGSTFTLVLPLVPPAPPAGPA